MILLLLFSGCSQKVVIQKELCYELQDVIISDDIQIRVIKMIYHYLKQEITKSTISFL